MLVLPGGKIAWVLGLDWTDAQGADVVEQLRDLIGDEAKAYFLVSGKKATGRRLGYSTLTGEPRLPKKAKGYSLADALASVGKDGVYFVEEGHQGWYAVISDGALVRDGGEAVMSLDDALAAAKQMAQLLSLPIFSSSSLISTQGPLDLNEIATLAFKAKRKPAIVRELGKRENKAFGVIVLLAVVGAIGFGGWHFLFKKDDKKLTPAQIAEQQKQIYVQSVRSAMPTLYEDRAWVIEALSEAQDAFPAVYEGWVLDGLQCQADGCTATYSVSKDHTFYSLSAMQDRFGATNLILQSDMRSLVLTSSRLATSISHTDDEILNPEVHGLSIVDVHGMAGVKLPQAELDSAIAREQLGNGQIPPLASAVMHERVTTMGKSQLQLANLAAVNDFMSGAGFYAQTLTYSPGTGNVTPGWRVDWSRINGIN